ncbi:hypothetical protein [Thermaurantiacus sp.]
MRLSAERFGIPPAGGWPWGAIDWLDLSLWSTLKAPEDAPGTRLIDHFRDLPPASDTGRRGRQDLLGSPGVNLPRGGGPVAGHHRP